MSAEQQPKRHRTAMSRTALSRPIRLALEHGFVSEATTVMDYGCGQGDDLKRLRARGISAWGWDPVHRPKGRKQNADIVNLGYVVNVIEDPKERLETLRRAWDLAGKVLVVSARLTAESQGVRLKPYGDGHLTGIGTFQKFYQQSGLRDWIGDALEVNAVAAAPGIFYVFRDEGLRQAFLATRYRRRSAVPIRRQSDVLFDQHRELLDPLMTFIADRGRLPDESELEGFSEIASEFGSLPKAFLIIRRATGQEHWDEIRDDREQDLLIYLALMRFGGRPKFSDLPQELQLDVKAFYGAYTRACKAADELLFSVGDLELVRAACDVAPAGKRTQAALYVHESALDTLPPLLRVYEGCARSYLGAVEDANVIKLNRLEPKVSYLSYPEFERDPHPALASSFLVHLQTFKETFRDYRESENPPILHRKEEFVAEDHELRPKFERLTKQEERWGLYDSTEGIGSRRGWEAALVDKGARVAGHRLVRRRDS